MPNQENGTLKMAEILWHFCSLLPHLLLMAMWCVGRKVTNSLAAPWDSKERVELACNVLDCVGDAQVLFSFSYYLNTDGNAGLVLGIMLDLWKQWWGLRAAKKTAEL